MRGRISTLVVGAALAVAPVAAQAEERSRASAVAVKHLQAELGEAALAGVVVTDEYTSPHNRVTHVYLRQASGGTPIVGAEATVNVQRNRVIFAGHRFLSDPAAATSGTASLTRRAAVGAAVRSVEARRGQVRGKPRLAYQLLPSGRARLAYLVQIEAPHHWYELAVDAARGKVIAKRDHVDRESAPHVAARTARPETAEAVEAAVAASTSPQQVKDGSSYRVFPMPLESPNDGPRATVFDPADALASPFGWHDTDGAAGPEFTTTQGNNVNAYHDTAADNAADPASQPDGGAQLDFDHPIVTYDATPATYRDAAVDNLFYWNNVMHDVTFGYGFDEQAGNFQQTNYSGAGKGEDPVLAEAQDGSFVLNANFATPEDGQSGRMQMFLWVDAFETLGLRPDDVARVYSTQVRDGDLDAGVIAHEYGHGISNRLVGGPSNVSCLRTHDERQGEGWSDFWSYAMTMRPGDDGRTPRGIGTYVIYQDEGRTAGGIRPTPYSTDMRLNPATLNTIADAAEPHGVGYVWATMLWDLYWNLVDAHGFNPNLYDSWETGGNNLAIQLVVDGMKMVTCEPGFEDARDAILAADAALTGDPVRRRRGENECLIWRTFARRGLGVSADQGDPAIKTDQTEGYDVPAHCAAG